MEDRGENMKSKLEIEIDEPVSMRTFNDRRREEKLLKIIAEIISHLPERRFGGGRTQECEYKWRVWMG
jgi:hypothetical protein